MGIVNISGQSVEKGSQYGDSKYKWSVSGERFSIWGYKYKWSVKISNFIATLIFEQKWKN
jgi:hypothetical protein